MSKKAKLTSRALRRARKAARKTAQNLQYAAWKLAGKNTKSRRAKLRKQRSNQVRSTDHSHGPCGNIGCKRCNPALYNLLPPRLLAAV
jgi:hypothetical protein